jgi:hypothetical protein
MAGQLLSLASSPLLVAVPVEDARLAEPTFQVGSSLSEAPLMVLGNSTSNSITLMASPMQ